MLDYYKVRPGAGVIRKHTVSKRVTWAAAGAAHRRLLSAAVTSESLRVPASPQLPYHVIEVNPLTKSEISWSSYKKVPILKWDDQSGKHPYSLSPRSSHRLFYAHQPHAMIQPPHLTTQQGMCAHVCVDVSVCVCVIITGTVETDSSVIMSRLATELTAKTAPKPPPGAPKATPAPTGRALEEEERWRRWVDERFVKVITANIYRSWE